MLTNKKSFKYTIMKLLYTILITLSLTSCHHPNTKNEIQNTLTTTIPIVNTFDNIFKLYAVESAYYTHFVNGENDLCYFRWKDSIEQLSDENAFINLKPIHGYTICVLTNTIIPSYMIYNGNLTFDIYITNGSKYLTSIGVEWDHRVHIDLLMDEIGVDNAIVNILLSGLIFKDLRSNSNQSNCTFDTITKDMRGVVVCGDSKHTLSNAPIDATIKILDNYTLEIHDNIGKNNETILYKTLNTTDIIN